MANKNLVMVLSRAFNGSYTRSFVRGLAAGLGNPDFVERRARSSSSARAKIARDHSFETRLRPETVPVTLSSCLRLSSDGSSRCRFEPITFAAIAIHRSWDST